MIYLYHSVRMNIPSLGTHLATARDESTSPLLGGMNSKCHSRCLDPSRKRDFRTVTQGTYAGAWLLIPHLLWQQGLTSWPSSSMMAPACSTTSKIITEHSSLLTDMVMLAKAGSWCMNSNNCSVGQRKHWYDDCKASGFLGFLTLHKCMKLQLNSFENCSGVLHFPLVPVAKKSPVCTLSSRARTQLHSLTGVLIDSQGSSLANSKSTSASNI